MPRRLPRHDRRPCYERRLLRPVRISLIRISGCSKAAKCPPLIGLAVVNQVAVGVFDPAPRQAWDVAREHRHRDRQRQPRAGESGRFVLPVDAAGRRGTVCVPVERDCVQHVIGAERVLGEPVIVRFGLELFVDPGCLAGRRVRQSKSDGLWLRALKVGLIHRDRRCRGRGCPRRSALRPTACRVSVREMRIECSSESREDPQAA